MARKVSFEEALKTCVLTSKHTNRGCFSWIASTYKTLVDLGLIESKDEYVGDKNNIPSKYRASMTRIIKNGSLKE